MSPESNQVSRSRARPRATHSSRLKTHDSVLILGLAREGTSLARYFRDRGEHVIVTDGAPAERLQTRVDELGGDVELQLGGDFPDLVHRAGRFFVSPGVPLENPVYRAARECGLLIESMTTLFFELCPAPIIGVTGSSGKTTTTSLIGHILRTAGEDAVVGGNIGDPMLDLLPRIQASTRVVLELSSFQLETLQRSPQVAVVTNISPNHLDRHGTMDAYIAAKQRIVRFQTEDDIAVLNAGDGEAESFRVVAPGAVNWFGWQLGERHGTTVEADTIVWRHAGGTTPVLEREEIPLLGRHNVENVLAALAVALPLGIAPEHAKQAVISFRPPAHRLETVARHNGVRYIDDSIATSPARAAVALQAVGDPVILIAGGRDKNLPWDEFTHVVARRTRALVLIGESAGRIEAGVRAAMNGSATLQSDAIVRCTSLEEAVREASRRARPGDAVLLSPACTSFDMFTNFEERGDAFRRAVEALDAA